MITKLKTLLLVEDEAVIALAQQKTLQRYGYVVVTALSGEEAIRQVSENPDIDLVLTDIDLGDGISGTDAASAILAIKDIPVVFLSSHTEPDVVAKTEGITSYGYIVKNSGGTVIDASIKMAFRLYEARCREQAKEELLERKLHYEELLSSIATLAIKLTDLDQFFSQALGMLGSKLKLSRTYIFRYLEKSHSLENPYEWCAPSISQQINNQQNLDAANFSYHLDDMKQGESVIITDVMQLEASPFRSLLESQEILSLQLVPIFVHAKFYGFLGFDECLGPRAWPDGDQGLLKSLAGLISGVIERDISRQALAEREERLHALSDNIPDGMVYQVEVDPGSHSRSFTFVSRSVRQMHQLEIEQVLANPMTLYEQILPDDALALQEAEEVAMRTMTTFRMVASFRLPDGSIRQRLLTSAPRYSPTGTILWDGVEVDIGARPYE